MDTNTKLEGVFKKANAEVEESGISDPELKKIAFSKAVDFYLNTDIKQQSSRTKTTIVEQISFWDSLSSATGIEMQFLKDIYSIKDEQILLVISTIPGDSKADKQRSIAALILFAYHEGLKYEWVPSNLLAEGAAHSKLYDRSKFATNLKKSDWFRTEGIKKGLKYKLSGPGLSQAKSLLVAIPK